MFLDPETNELKGLEPDTAAAFAKALGVELEIVQTEWDALIPSLIADKFDIIIANMGRLPSRAAVVDFTLAFENYDGTCIAVRKNEDKIKGWEDFKKGVKVGTGRGNVAEAYTKNTYPDIDMVPFASPQLAIQALVAGQVDCVVEDYTAMVSFAKEFDAIKLVATDPLVNVKMTGFAIKPGNFRLWLWANIFLIDFKNSGEHAKLWYKWFPDIPIVKAPFEIN
jgi:polar amino acid transport system substrate-binding protein